MTLQPILSSPDQSASTSSNVPGKHRQRAVFWEAGMLGVILLVALLLRLWHLSAVTDNYDEGVYWSSLRAMYAGHGLFTPVFSSQPPFFLLSLYPLVALLGPTQMAARLGVVLLSLVSILGMYLLARRLGGPWAGLGAALLLASDPLYLIQSQTIDAEVPSVAFLIVAVAAAAYADRYPWQAALISGAATALAILEKLFAVAALAAILPLFVGHLLAFERTQLSLKEQEPPHSMLARLRMPQRQTLKRAAVLAGAYLLGLALAGMLIFLPYLHELQSAYQQVIAFHLAADQSYASTLSQNPQILLGVTTEYPLAILALCGIVLGLFRRRRHVLLVIIWIVVVLIILLRQAPLFTRHLVLLVPVLALSVALGFAPEVQTWAAEARALGTRLQHIRPGWATRASKALLIGAPVLLLAGLFFNNLYNLLLYPLGPIPTAPQVSQVASDLQRLTTPQQQVITDDQYIAALANRDVPPELVDTSDVRIVTGYLTAEQVITLAEQPQVGAVLFYTGRLDKLPGVRAWVEQHFHLARSYGKGQDLYLRAGP
ncbi:MAG TPA: glycosyltransferase family 39 protein [Ktedonobacterales bacterium]|nr:glycosyltransferase family 39 protein [Ktedonobacterales bacterium]